LRHDCVAARASDAIRDAASQRPSTVVHFVVLDGLKRKAGRNRLLTR